MKQTLVEKLLQTEIRLKNWWAKKRGWISETGKEVDFVYETFGNGYIKPFETLKHKFHLKYLQDKLWGFLPWDRQFDSIELMKRKSGDCNSINRLIQIMAHIYYRIETVYLVHYIAKPLHAKHWWYWLMPWYWLYHQIAMSHGTCIMLKDGKWYSYDYGYKSRAFDTIEACISHLAYHKYNSIASVYVRQDLIF